MLSIENLYLEMEGDSSGKIVCRKATLEERGTTTTVEGRGFVKPSTVPFLVTLDEERDSGLLLTTATIG